MPSRDSTLIDQPSPICVIIGDKGVDPGFLGSRTARFHQLADVVAPPIAAAVLGSQQAVEAQRLANTSSISTISRPRPPTP